MDTDQLRVTWMIFQCPSFRQSLDHIASKIVSIEVMKPMLIIAPISLAVYYTREPKLPVPQKPIVISQEPSGLITINAHPIHQQKETDTFNLCGISTVHSSLISPIPIHCTPPVSAWGQIRLQQRSFSNIG